MTTDQIILCPSCATANRVPSARLTQQPKCGKCGQYLFSGKPISLDTAGFDRLIKLGTLPVLVDFWASWCGPCRMMAPQFEAAAARLEPSVRLVKIDTEAEQTIAARYRIQSIPTLAIFDGGREIARQSGAMDQNSLVRWAENAIAAKRS